MGPFKCPDCGVWWAGLEHRCRPTEAGTEAPPTDTWVYRRFMPLVGSGSTSAAPWCAVCEGWHIPGAGPCTATWSQT